MEESRIHRLECPKRKCGRASPLIYEDGRDEVFYCCVHGEFKISEYGAILWKKLKIIKRIEWKEMQLHEL